MDCLTKVMDCQVDTCIVLQADLPICCLHSSLALAPHFLQTHRLQANAQTGKDCRMILDPLMQRYSYYSDNELFEEVVREPMRKASPQEARQADMKRFGQLKAQVCCSQHASCCQQS